MLIENPIDDPGTYTPPPDPTPLATTLLPVALFDSANAAFDGNEATSCVCDATVGQYGVQHFYGWTALATTPTSLKLKINTSVTGTGATDVSYSLNGGTSYTAIYSITGARAQQYDEVVLDPAQNLTQVRVRVSAVGTIIRIHEMRIEAVS